MPKKKNLKNLKSLMKNNFFKKNIKVSPTNFVNNNRNVLALPNRGTIVKNGMGSLVEKLDVPEATEKIETTMAG
mgnify:CR=1 FL=1